MTARFLTEGCGRYRLVIHEPVTGRFLAPFRLVHLCQSVRYSKHASKGRPKLYLVYGAFNQWVVATSIVSNHLLELC